jgi:hypothetical protein
VPRQIHAYRVLVSDIEANGIREPVELVTDGQHVALREGHKRVEAAMQLGLPTVPISLSIRPFGPRRRFKYPLGAGLQKMIDDIRNPPAPAKKVAKKAPAKKRAAAAKTAATVRK